MFYGRKEELNILNNRYNSNKFEFGYLYGARRIGKTFLIDEFSKTKKSIILFASDSDDNSIKNDFSRSFYEQTGIGTFASFDNWDDFFKAIANYFGDDNGLFVIDEYPNIVIGRDKKRKKTDFVSKLQNAIDHIFNKTKILFILTGSNVSFMENEISDSNAPLYKRHTFELLLSKLEWDDACLMLEGMDDFDKAKVLCLTDTFPYYLSQIDTSLSFDENLNYLFFQRDSIFVSDPSKLLTSDIMTGAFYTSIIRAIAEGHNTISDISTALSAESGKVALYLDELIKAKAISKHYVFGSKRMTYYKIVDRMCSFYFRFIFAYSERIKLGYGNIIKEKNNNQIDSFIHYSFEDLCITYLEYLNKKGKLETLYNDFTNYRVENSNIGRSIEIDVISEGDNHLLIGECKFSKNKKGLSELLNMQEDVSVPPFDKYKDKHFYLFSANGFDESLNKNNDKNIKLIDLNKMFR